ncbi:transposase [Paenibacillus larvae]|nr:transposase [Paenibacillus larvae]MDT2254725.1 transposase [Paenibacillus larvae]
MLFEDESMIRDYQAIQKTWFLRGKQHHSNHRQASWGQTAGLRLTMKRDTSFGKKKMNSTPLKRFFLFFKGHGDLATGKLALVWTMPGFIMQSCFGRFWKRKKIESELVYLPPYSPQLNIVEGLWKWLKSV